MFEEAVGAYDAVDFIPFFKKELCEVRSVLASDAGDERAGHALSSDFDAPFLVRLE
jgi:hypothetical protein